MGIMRRLIVSWHRYYQWVSTSKVVWMARCLCVDGFVGVFLIILTKPMFCLLSLCDEGCASDNSYRTLCTNIYRSSTQPGRNYKLCPTGIWPNTSQSLVQCATNWTMNHVRFNFKLLCCHFISGIEKKK